MWGKPMSWCSHLQRLLVQSMFYRVDFCVVLSGGLVYVCVLYVCVCYVCEDLCHWARRWAGAISHQVGSPLQALNLCLLLVLQLFPGYGWLWEEAEEEVDLNHREHLSFIYSTGPRAWPLARGSGIAKGLQYHSYLRLTSHSITWLEPGLLPV